MSEAETKHKPVAEDTLNGDAAMPEDYVTRQTCTANFNRVIEKIKDLKDSVDRSLDKMDEFEKRISNTETDVAVINKGIRNGKESDDKEAKGKYDRRTFQFSLWRIILMVVGIILASNIPDIIKYIVRL